MAPKELALVSQVHGAAVHFLEEKNFPFLPSPGDGMITRSKKIAMGILTADCLPVFFWDERKKAAGMAHAGWRGLRQGILLKMAQAFKAIGARAGSLRIAFGPCIRPCCYEVGEEFRDYFPAFYHPASKKGRGSLDLSAVARDQLQQEGVETASIGDAGICTSCSNDRFFSARKEKTSERMLSLIQILS